MSFRDISVFDPFLAGLSASVADEIEYEVKYECFMDRQRKEVEKFRHLENIRIPDGFSYDSVHGLSHEVRQKLGIFKPATLGQANRISGMTPAAISLLMIAFRRFFDGKEYRG